MSWWNPHGPVGDTPALYAWEAACGETGAGYPIFLFEEGSSGEPVGNRARLRGAELLKEAERHNP